MNKCVMIIGQLKSLKAFHNSFHFFSILLCHIISIIFEFNLSIRQILLRFHPCTFLGIIGKLKNQLRVAISCAFAFISD